MRFLKKLFYMPKYEKGTEMHLKQVLITSIIGVFLCIGCLAGTTWAWFQTTVQSTGNEITVGAARMTVSYFKNSQCKEEKPLPIGETYSIKLSDVSTYLFRIVNSGNVAGYCEIKITAYDNKGQELFSEKQTSGTLTPFVNNQDDNVYCMIELEITREDKYADVSHVLVEIVPHWGPDPKHEVANFEESFLEDSAEEDDSGDEDGADSAVGDDSGDNDDVTPDDHHNNNGSGTDDGTDDETGNGTEGETGNGTEGATGNGTEGETGNGTEGATGDGTEGTTGDGNNGQTGEGTDGETGDNGTDAQNGNGGSGEPSADADEA